MNLRGERFGSRKKGVAIFTVAALGVALSICAQPTANQESPDRPPFDGPPPRFFPGGNPPGNFRGGPPMGVQEDRKLVAQFDKDGDHRLNAAERRAAREFLAEEKSEGRGPRRFGPPGLRNEDSEPPKPGPKVTPNDVTAYGAEPLYQSNIVRTFFLEFEDADWEKALADFIHTDVLVPARLTVDGKVYRDVGVHFHGASSYFTVPEGRKRSLTLSMDFADAKQRLGGYRTIDLLNSHEDPTFLRAVLYCQIAREYLPAAKANYARVVINGESWGIYVNLEHFNKDFVKERFGSAKGARWKVPGSPRASGGLTYIGDDVADYKKHYEIKTKDDPKSWADLIKLCRILNQTASEELESKLAPMLDIDGALKFLALENVLINNDGYWIRTSDYNLYEDGKRQFHIIPHDVNETFAMPGGPGMRRGAQIKGVELDPLFGADDSNKPLLNKLLSVPALRKRYLGYVRDIAERWLDWNRLGPLAKQYQSLIADDVRKDTRKLDSFEAFTNGIEQDHEEDTGSPGPRFGPRRSISLKSFAGQRREYLLTMVH